MNAKQNDSTSPANGGTNAANHPNRRFTDSIGLRGRGLRSDRRVGDRDRRVGITTGYNGPPRRTTIDRRSSLNERRGAN